MAADSDNDWRNLRLGDKVRIVRIPSELSEPHYQDGEWEETFALYRTLISEVVELTVSEIDEFGCPWIEYATIDKSGVAVSNSLSLNDDSWERAD